MIARGRAFFKGKSYEISELNMHIPLPVQAVLVQAMGGFKTITPDANSAGNTYIYGLKCVAGYENRIVISHPAYAIFKNEPMVIIDLMEGNWPVYREIN